MRILQLHSNYIVFKPVEKEINIAEEAAKEETKVDEVVVLFTAIEEGDNSAMAQKAINDARAFLGKIKANRILIYPFAHLSSNLSQPSQALAIIKDMETYAKEKGIETFHAPFGWNKQFTISIKGHPLAEQARSYTPQAAAAAPQEGAPCEAKKEEEPVSAALKAEDTMKSYWHILQTGGSLVLLKNTSYREKLTCRNSANTKSRKPAQ
jgi:threonyl-tRNA synthetase